MLRVSVLVGCLMAATVACGGDDIPIPAATSTVAPIASPAATVPPATTPVANVCGANPSPAPNVQPAEFSYRMIAVPQPGATVTNPLMVSGQARPFEGAFSVTVFNGSGQQVASVNFTKSNVNLAFSVSLPYTVSAPTPACIWYHERSGRDGSPVNITQVPVLLQP